MDEIRRSFVLRAREMAGFQQTPEENRNMTAHIHSAETLEQRLKSLEAQRVVAAEELQHESLPSNNDVDWRPLPAVTVYYRVPRAIAY